MTAPITCPSLGKEDPRREDPSALLVDADPHILISEYITRFEAFNQEFYLADPTNMSLLVGFKSIGQ